MTTVPPELRSHLQMHYQEHLLFGWDSLSEADRKRWVEELDELDFVQLAKLYNRRNEPHAALPARERIAPLPVELRSEVSAKSYAIGEEAIRKGRVAVLLVAGGQGSRLGTDRPKGVYPVGPISGASLFQIHAEKVLALQRRYHATIPLLIMTSPATHSETVAYFEEQSYFGLPKDDVYFFEQGTMPAIDLRTGSLLLEAPGKLCRSPNGHGGTITALADSGLLINMKADGIEQIFYFQVDNPLVRVADPAFIGRHVETQSEVSSKVVFKEHPEEKVGILSLVDDRCSIIEYSDLPKDMAEERTSAGELVYRAGSPAIHIFSISFLERITTSTQHLDYHIARKKVPCLDRDGQPFQPTSENAIKCELFIFDALPMADRWMAMAVDRADEFAPLKNATGADSPETVRHLMMERAARMLESAGVDVPRENGELKYPLEISPLFALDERDCQRKIPASFPINGPTLFNQTR